MKETINDKQKTGFATFWKFVRQKYWPIGRTEMELLIFTEKTDGKQISKIVVSYFMYAKTTKYTKNSIIKHMILAEMGFNYSSHDDTWDNENIK